ncbi:hypothetical protein ACJX0J_018431, partial [Zea mays]
YIFFLAHPGKLFRYKFIFIGSVEDFNSLKEMKRMFHGDDCANELGYISWNVFVFLFLQGHL